MTKDIRIKICGLQTAEHIRAAAEAGAAYVGFVFFEKSPRNISVDEAAELALTVPMGIAKVALTVNATNAELDKITNKVALDMLQLHGSETPERVREVRQRYGLPVMKVVGVADAADLDALASYEDVADQILVDAKPPKDAKLPGGNGLAFDWNLIAGRRWAVPWMLAGGLTPENVALAIKVTGVHQVDVSSGIEVSPGVKNSRLIKQFCQAALSA